MLPLLTLMAGLISAPSSNIILITIDGVRWQEVFNGTDPVLDRTEHLIARELLPNLYDLFVDHGTALGQKSLVIASGPKHISLPGYLEITRGHPSKDCQSNACQPKIDQSIFYLFPYPPPAVFASWETIDRTEPPYLNIVSNTGRTRRSQVWGDAQFPEYNNYPTPFTWLPDYRPDYYTAELATVYIEERHPDFAWLALGDTDEWGHANSYTRYLLALQAADIYIGTLVHELEATDYGQNTVFILTTDHGRAANFRDHGYDQASARVWMMFHGKGIPSKGSIRLPQIISLSNILPTIGSIENIPAKGNLLPMMEKAQ